MKGDLRSLVGANTDPFPELLASVPITTAGSLHTHPLSLFTR